MSPTWAKLLQRVFSGIRSESKKNHAKRLRKESRSQLSFEELEDRVVPSGGTWEEISTNVTAGWGQPMLLSNGDIMIQTSPGGAQSNVWYTLAPGPDGNYGDGTLTKIAPMGLARLAYGSAVLPNGDVMIYGGEYSGSGSSETFVNSGQIYNPLTNTWKTIASIPTSLDPTNLFGDDPLEVLPNGEVLAGYLAGTQTFIYNPATNTWSAGPTKIDPGVSGFTESTDEESWVKLPGTGGNILNYDLWGSLNENPGYGQYLDTSSMKWVSTGSVPVPLSNTVEYELGPALLLPTGQVLQIGANGTGGSPTNTAFYNPGSNTWSAGPTIPNGQTADDAPGAVLPDGNVIFAADAGPTSAATSGATSRQYQPPTQLFEFNGASIGQMVLPPALAAQVVTQPAFDDQMLDLPNGQILFDNDTSDLWLYSESGNVDPSWAPTITGLTNNGGGTYTLTGTQLNGMDEGAEYGDDALMATNYPIIQLTSSTGVVYNAFSFDWSSTGVATGNEPVSTEFTLPAKLPAGEYSLTADANGISSQPIEGIFNGTVFTPQPVVTAVNPDIGPEVGGTTVTINGIGLAGATAVDFGNTPATIVNDTGSQIVATSPAGAVGTVDITVATPGGISGTSPADQFTYAIFPSVTGISPSAGPVAGGSTVTISGTDLSEVTGVDFGSTPANFTIVSNNDIQATSPAGSLGAVDVTVSNVNGTSSTSAADLYTYVAPPTVTAVSPDSGPIAGGTVVTITGTNLNGATEVEFGSVIATVLSDQKNQIVVTSPKVTAIGNPDITVTTAGGTSATSTADQFLYLSVPTVTGLNLAQGPLYGGLQVTIFGTSLLNATAVDFGTRLASIVKDTNDEIEVITPTGAGGTVDVTVTTSYGKSSTSAADQFTYIPAPIVSSLSTTSGPLNGGNTITISGSNLLNASEVDFGSAAATIVTDTANQIVVTDPAETAGAVEVTVTTGGGTSLATSNSLFTYVAVPVITGISPAQSPLSGEKVTITGTALSNAILVDFGTNGATIQSDSATQIVVISPSGTGMENVTVTTAGGTSSVSAATQFTYVPAPTVTGVSPGAGPLAAGATITITGTNLANATLVDFGKKAATVLSDNGTQIQVVNPVETAGTVDVTVTTVGGTSAPSSADQFTYAPVPAVTGLATIFGTSTVIISGTGLANATVDFGANPASILSDTPTQIQVTAPSGSPGTVDVTATTAGGTSATSVADLFTYGAGATPQVQSITPSTGLPSGGTNVAIFGSNFTANSEVVFGSAPAREVKVVGSGEIIATAPAQGTLASTVDVTVTTNAGISPLNTGDEFTYVPFSLATSTLLLSNPTTQSGSSITVSLQVNDASGNAVANGNLTVAFQLAGTTGGQGTFGPVTYSNGTYSAQFTGTIAGNNKIVALIDGSKVTSSTPAIAVTPGQASVATSYITISSSTVQAGNTITVTLHAVDAAGNKETTGGLAVSFSLANNTPVIGSFPGFTTDNNNGTYTTTFTGLLPGTNSIGASLGGPNIAATVPVTVIPGKAYAAESFVTTASDIVEAGTTTIVTLQAVDALGNYETKGGLAVTFGLGGTGTGGGTFSKTIDNGNGTYSATFTGTVEGGNTIVAKFGGAVVTSFGFPPEIVVTPGQVSLTNSLVKLVQSTVTSGDSITVLFQAKDAYGNIVPLTNPGVGFFLGNPTGGQGTFTLVNSLTNGLYSATFMGTIAGTNRIQGSIDGLALTSKAPVITVTPGAVDLANSIVVAPVNTVGLNGTTTVTLVAKDSYGNRLNTGGLSVLLILLNPTGGAGTFTKVVDNHNGTYSATFTGVTPGDNEIFGLIDDGVVTSNPALIRIV
jgi:hypothetical protein